MRVKSLIVKIFVISVLILAYVYFVNTILVPSIVQGSVGGSSVGGGSVAGQGLNIGASVSVLVERPYIFGLIRMPVQIGATKIAWIHEMFFLFIYTLAIIFIFSEI